MADDTTPRVGALRAERVVRDAARDRGWAEATELHPLGSRASGTVSEHTSFGAFVTLADTTTPALVRIVELDDDGGPKSAADFPPIGTEVTGVVIAHAHNHQILISLRWSDVGR